MNKLKTKTIRDGGGEYCYVLIRKKLIKLTKNGSNLKIFNSHGLTQELIRKL